jgi:hypothetical protein
MGGLNRLPLAIVLLLCLHNSVFGQEVRHQSPVFIERGITTPLIFDFPAFADGDILEAILFYRSEGRSSYRQIEARIIGSRAEFPILIQNEETTSLEYYFLLRLVNGRQISYPDILDEPPVRTDVVEPRDGVIPEAGFIDVAVVSPRPGTVYSSDDVLVAVALFYDDEAIEEGQFIVKLNSLDVTADAEITPYMIKYKPPMVSAGNQNVEILFVRNGRTYKVSEVGFQTAEGGGMMLADVGSFGRVAPSGEIELGARNQVISAQNNDALTGRARISGSEGHLSYSLNGLLTSQESSRLQPQNRFNADFRYSDWVELRLGDAYPTISNLSVTGRRVRGIHSKISLFDERFEMQFVLGQLNRQVRNKYGSLLYTDIEINGNVAETDYILTFDDGGRGTFSQNMIGGRLSVGNSDRFQFSIHGFKIQDDTTSLDVIRNYNDLLVINPDLAAGLREDDRTALESDPDQLQIQGSNPRPVGNVIFGTEFMGTFDEQRIRYQSELSVSLLNLDISRGPLTQVLGDEIGIDITEEQESLFDRLSWLIIINENMSTLPFKYRENDFGNLELIPFFPTSILANESRVDLRYFEHHLQLQYQWIGPDYQSLANSTIRRDNSGITITDRFRILDNRLYFTLGYESLRDNLTGSRPSTLRTNTSRASISWFPVNPILPRMNISTRFRVRDNNVGRFNPFLPEELEKASVRNYTVSNGDVITAPASRSNTTLSLTGTVSQSFNALDINHQVSVSAGVISTRDDVFTFGNSESQSYSINLESRFLDNPYRTRIGWNNSTTYSLSDLNRFKINSFNVGGDVFLMDDKLILNGDISIAFNRLRTIPLVVNDNGNPNDTSDNYFESAGALSASVRHTNAYIFRIGAQYDINANHALMGTINYSNLVNPLNRSESFNNDRILQLRYILRF